MALFQTFPEVAEFLDGLPRVGLAREISLSSGLYSEVVEDRGLLSALLAHLNYRIVSLEPGGVMASIFLAMRARLSKGSA